MKPKHLKFPTTWDERKVLIADRVWYIPEHYSHFDHFHFPGWSHADLFGREAPVVVEYCSGNGAWIIAKAQQRPDLNWIGVEWRFDRIRKIWAKAKDRGLNNLVAICGEAYTATNHYFPSSSVREVYINFPDPWPKKRHAKHRLIQPRFVTELWRILEVGGAVNLVTDDPDYSDIMVAEFGAHSGFVSQFTDPYYTTEWPDYGESFFDSLWREKGRTIRYHCFRKRLV